MNFPRFIQIDPLAGVLSLIAIFYSLYALYYTRRQERRNACFRLLELWLSDYYSQARNEGWYQLEALSAPISMKDLHRTNPLLSNHIWVVIHFLEHLHALYSQNVVDRPLARALFGKNVVRWVELFGIRLFGKPKRSSIST